MSTTPRDSRFTELIDLDTASSFGVPSLEPSVFTLTPPPSSITLTPPGQRAPRLTAPTLASILTTYASTLILWRLAHFYSSYVPSIQQRDALLAYSDTELTKVRLELDAIDVVGAWESLKNEGQISERVLQCRVGRWLRRVPELRSRIVRLAIERTEMGRKAKGVREELEAARLLTGISLDGLMCCLEAYTNKKASEAGAGVPTNGDTARRLAEFKEWEMLGAHLVRDRANLRMLLGCDDGADTDSWISGSPRPSLPSSSSSSLSPPTPTPQASSSSPTPSPPSPSPPPAVHLQTSSNRPRRSARPGSSKSNNPFFAVSRRPSARLDLTTLQHLHILHRAIRNCRRQHFSALYYTSNKYFCGWLGHRRICGERLVVRLSDRESRLLDGEMELQSQMHSDWRRERPGGAPGVGRWVDDDWSRNGKGGLGVNLGCCTEGRIWCGGQGAKPDRWKGKGREVSSRRSSRHVEEMPVIREDEEGAGVGTPGRFVID